MNEMTETTFNEIINLIHESRLNAYKAVNKELITLYWNIGKIISQKIENEKWGNVVIENLANYINKTQPDIKGFSARNIWRMKQFYEIYKNNEKLSPLVTEINWSSNLLIMSKTKTNEEREFYLKLAIKEHYSKRELERQLDSCFYERYITSQCQLSPVLLEIHPKAEELFKESYMLEFLGIKEVHSENEFKNAIINNLKNFILEFGKDFLFIGQEYRLQVGNHDYFIDLLFYHRELSCLVAFELKVNEFKPEYMGKLEFYLEALDRDVKKSHEKPSIGILLCKTKDDIVVEYALSRTLSPTLIAEYQTKLIDKKLLHDKIQKLLED